MSVAGPGHRLVIGLFAAVLALWIAVMAVLMREASLPPGETGTMLVVFEPGTPAGRIFAAITRAQANPVRATAFGFIWVVTSAEPGLAGRLRQQGAIGTYRELPISPTLAGCFALADAKAAAAFGL